MRTGRDFGEDDVVTLDEEFDAEDAMAAEGVGDLTGYLFSLLEGNGRHGLGLPAALVVAIFLIVPDRRAEGSAADVTHSEESDLIVEIDETLDDDGTMSGASTLLRLFPSLGDILLTAHQALTMTRRTHHRLNDAGETDAIDGSDELLLGVGKLKGGCGETQCDGSEVANLATIHGSKSGFGGGHHIPTLLLEGDQGGGGDSLDLGDDVVGLLLLDDATQCIAIEH